jgi:hypothetical protein
MSLVAALTKYDLLRDMTTQETSIDLNLVFDRKEATYPE